MSVKGLFRVRGNKDPETKDRPYKEEGKGEGESKDVRVRGLKLTNELS